MHLLNLLLAAEDNPLMDHLIGPWIQAGFASFAAALLLILVWFIKRLLQLQEDWQEVLTANSAAIAAFTKAIEDHTRSADSLALQIAGLRDGR